MTTLKTNEDRLVEFLLQGAPIPPTAYGWEISHQGEARFVPSVGGITTNIQIGDSVTFFEGDHLEPGVSCFAGGFNDKRSGNPNLAFNVYSCIGNEAEIISGKAKGKKGTVIGHHGGVEHVILDFPEETILEMTYDDKIIIRAKGQGLKLSDFPDIRVMSLDPKLLQLIPTQINGAQVTIPVTTMVPAACMGSGLGHSDNFKGDYDIQTSDPATVKQFGFDQLRFGDLVAITDHDSRYGWSYKQGAVSIAVVVHGDSFLAGHGPGVQTIMTTVGGNLVPVLDKNANIGNYLKIGRYLSSRA